MHTLRLTSPVASSRFKDPDGPVAGRALQAGPRARGRRQIRSDRHEPERHLDGHAAQDSLQPVRATTAISPRNTRVRRVTDC